MAKPVCSSEAVSYHVKNNAFLLTAIVCVALAAIGHYGPYSFPPASLYTLSGVAAAGIVVHILTHCIDWSEDIDDQLFEFLIDKSINLSEGPAKGNGKVTIELDPTKDNRDINAENYNSITKPLHKARVREEIGKALAISRDLSLHYALLEKTTIACPPEYMSLSKQVDIVWKELLTHLKQLKDAADQ